MLSATSRAEGLHAEKKEICTAPVDKIRKGLTKGFNRCMYNYLVSMNELIGGGDSKIRRLFGCDEMMDVS